MMGRDCGTAIINGAALCFGNAVRHWQHPARIGASGTGSQELSVVSTISAVVSRS